MKIGDYKFKFQLADDAELPLYKGSTFRGVLGHALKRTVCALKHQECRTCILRSNCTYAMVFETTYTIAQPKGARVSSPPHPMVLEPPLTEKRKFSKDDFMECSLILFGKINLNLPYFIYAFEQMGKIGIGKKINHKRAGFSLVSVTHKGEKVYSKQDNIIRKPGMLPDLNLLSSYNEFQDSEFSDNVSPNAMQAKENLKIKIITPLRIMDKRGIRADLPFSVLIRSLIRRTTSLLNTYGDGEPELDYTGLAQKARDIEVTNNNLSWFDWQRYSSRQDIKMFMGGLTGEIEYHGNLTPFMPFVRMAEIVHAGKNTAFGLGKINII